MDQVIDLYKEDIATIRTGRATPALLEEVKVSVYGGQQKMKLKQLGAIHVADARSLTLQPWDVAIIKEIKNGILNSGSGLTPTIEGDIIRITLPSLTTEQRSDYVKLLGKKTEAARVITRDIRGRERHQLQERLKKKEISKDEYHRLESKLQEITDEEMVKIDEIAARKEKEIMGEQL